MFVCVCVHVCTYALRIWVHCTCVHVENRDQLWHFSEATTLFYLFLLCFVCFETNLTVYPWLELPL